MTEEQKEQLREYLKENLQIRIREDSYNPGYGYGGSRTINVQIVLDEEVISSDCFYIDEE